jgi:hypothetical protein
MGMISQDRGLTEIGESIALIPGVRTVWVHRFSEPHAGIWVLIGGVGDSTWFTRRRVHAELLKSLRAHHPAMDATGFVFERYIFTDQEEVENPPIPPDARQITRSEISA